MHKVQDCCRVFVFHTATASLMRTQTRANTK